MSEENVLHGCVGCVILIVVVLFVGGLCVLPMLKIIVGDTVKVSITKSERVSEGRSARYLIFTENEVFENTDVFLLGKFNSSDVYNYIEVGHTYECAVIGWRIPYLSWYRNIIGCTEL